MADSMQRISNFFASLTPKTLSNIDQVYADDAFFKDPFNEVKGLERIKRIFSHMFEALVEPHFVITSTVTQGQHGVLFWDFRFKLKQWQPHTWQIIQGCSRISLDGSGKINYHRDYWDTSEELYQKLPVLGRLMRWLKRRSTTPQA